MEDFCRKARLVAGGHMTKTQAIMNYAIVVSHETVSLELVIAVLNDLEVNCVYVLNAYITSPIEEKVWTALRPEVGNDAGKRALIFPALYGLKSSGDDFCAHLCRCIQ